MNIGLSFDERFKQKYNDLKEKYGDEMLQLEGIDMKSMDIAHMEDQFNKSAVISDFSVDGNANVDDTSILSFEYEFPKSTQKLNSYHTVWKYMTKKQGVKRANKCFEMMVNGELKLHDAHSVRKPYSYYQETPIVIRINGGAPHVVTLKKLFKTYSEFIVTSDEAEVIDLNNVFKSVHYDMAKVFTSSGYNQIQRTKHDDEYGIRNIHKIETMDKSGKWVPVSRILRHKRHNKMILYQTNNGDFSFVTEDHPVILNDGSEKLAGQLSIGDKVLEEREIDFTKIPETIDVDTDISYLIGFLLGDGNAERHKFYGNFENLLEDDVSIVFNKICNGCCIYQKNITDHKIYNIIMKHFNESVNRMKNGGIRNTNNRMYFNSRIFNLMLIEFFNMDGGSSSFLKELPTNILSWKKSSKLAFIAGLLDSDGTILENNAFDVRMKSYSLIQALNEVCKSVGFDCKKRVCGNQKTDMFGITIYPTDNEVYTYSEKCKNKNITEVYNVNKKYDTTKKGSGISKLFIIDETDELFSPYNEGPLLEYVYDITTESGHFYSGGMVQHNCYAFDLAPIVYGGMPFIKKIKINKPNRFKSFVNLVIQLTAYASNQIMGAIAYPNLFIYADWYARMQYGENYLKDPKVAAEIKEELQSLVYSFNFPFRGSQSSFTNLNVYDKFFMEDLFKDLWYPDGTQPNFESIDRLQKFYMNWFVSEMEKQTLTFPVNTATFYKNANGEIEDTEFLEYVSELNCKSGVFNIFTGKLGILSSCCRLLNDSTSTTYQNSFGASGVSIGSVRVVTLNLPSIAYESENLEEFMKKLDYRIEAAQDVLETARDIVADAITANRLPLYSHGLMHLSKQFMTLGHIGLYEALEVLKIDITSEEGKSASYKILERMNKKNKERSDRDNMIRNVEGIPGESAAVTLCKKDKLRFKNNEYRLYSNQYIPLIKPVDMHERLKIQGHLDSQNSGGAICHINVDNQISKEQMKEIILYAAKCGVIYFAVNMVFSRCKTCNTLFIGKLEKSPCHNAETSKYIRVVGFLTEVSNWNKTRRDYEFDKRQLYGSNDFNQSL